MQESPSYMAEIYDLLNKSSDSQDIYDLVTKRMVLLGLSERQLSSILGIGRPSLSRQKNGEAQKIDLLSALKIIQFLGLSVNDFIKIYVSSLPAESIAEIEKVRKANFLIENFDLKTLKKVGFIESTTSYDEIEKKVISHFGLNSIFEYRSDLAYALFSRTKKGFSDKMLEFWVKSAFSKFTKMNNPNDFDLGAVRDLTTKMRSYTRDVDMGLVKVAKALYHLGVTVIVQEYLPKTQIRGATFLVNGKPCIVLSNYRGNYSTLWFALMHELAHVIYDLDKLAGTHYHISGLEDLFLIEDDANLFAQEMLFPQEKLDYIKPFINSYPVVEKYAEQNKVHLSIIYNFYINRMKEDYPNQDPQPLYIKYSKLTNVDTSKTIKNLSSSAWTDATIDIGVENIKKILSNIETIINEND